MGQAASYAESSVQRALLKLKQEEQTEEDELLCACGFRRSCSSPVTAKPSDVFYDGDSSDSGQPTPALSRSTEKLLPVPPESLGPFISLSPEYYTLDELRDALRYLPDALWVSLYRVSLLYVLDNDHDGRVNATDISFFMDWGIKTVGRDVPPEQLAEVLQTYAALHCWHRCLHVGEEIELERATAAAQQSSRGGAGGSGGARTRRRQLPSHGGGGPSPPHHHHPAQSVSSFMLLHLREAFANRRPGGPMPLPSNMGTVVEPILDDSPSSNSGAAQKDSAEAAALSSPPAPQFFSPRSAVTQPVTNSTRLEAAAHFAEWMLRLVQNQERDRRHERQRLERRLRCISASEMVMCNPRLRHSQYLQHHSMRLRGSVVLLQPPLLPQSPQHSQQQLAASEGAESEDVVIASQTTLPTYGLRSESESEANTVLQGSTPAPTNTENGSAVAAENQLHTASPPSTTAPPQPLLNNAALGRLLSSPSSSTVSPLGPVPSFTKVQRDMLVVEPPPALLSGGGYGGNNTVNSLGSTSASAAAGAGPVTVAAGGALGGSGSGSSSNAAGAGQEQPHPSDMSPQRPNPRQTSNMTATSTTNVSSRALPSFAYQALSGGLPDESTLLSTTATRDGMAGLASGGGGGGGSGFSNGTGWVSSFGHGTTNAAAGAASPATSLSAHQLSAVLMDSEPLYTKLEREGWCTIGAVEEVYLDFAVEESYCLSFWSFCRLLNESSADEVQAALELTTVKATAVLTSAIAVEDYRRAAAVRQFQRLNSSSGSGSQQAAPPLRASERRGGWAEHLSVVPMFLVSEYTFVTFVTAFIHAYWDMLESMGVDPVTQPAEMASMMTARSTSAAFRGA